MLNAPGIAWPIARAACWPTLTGRSWDEAGHHWHGFENRWRSPGFIPLMRRGWVQTTRSGCCVVKEGQRQPVLEQR